MIVIWILFAIASALVAGAKGRNALGWFFLGLLLPLISLIIIAVLPPVAKEIANANMDTKKCPFCAEVIKDDAIKCKHCGEMIGKKVDNTFVNKICPKCSRVFDCTWGTCPDCNVLLVSQGVKENTSS